MYEEVDLTQLTHSAQIGLPYVFAFLISIVFILFITRQKFWISFSQKKKRLSRVALFIMCCFSLFFLEPSGGIVFSKYGKATVWAEEPQLTATAIKLGLHRLYTIYHLKNQLPPPDAPLVECIASISETNHQKLCGADSACKEMPPPMTRQEIVANIKNKQADKTSPSYEACKDVALSEQLRF